MGIVHESPSGEGKELIFDVIARNQPLEECKERSDRVKTNPENNSLLKIHDTINCTNAFQLHTVSTMSFIFNTKTGISLLCFGNLVGHIVVFFSESAIKHASWSTERKGRSCLCTLAATVGSQHVWKSRRNQDVTATASLKMAWLMSALLWNIQDLPICNLQFIFQLTDQLHLPPKKALLQLKEKRTKYEFMQQTSGSKNGWKKPSLPVFFGDVFFN